MKEQDNIIIFDYVTLTVACSSMSGNLAMRFLVPKARPVPCSWARHSRQDFITSWSPVSPSNQK